MNLLLPTHFSMSNEAWIVGIILIFVAGLLVWQVRQFGVWNKIIGDYDADSSFIVSKKRYGLQLITTFLLMSVIGMLVAFRPSVTTQVPTKKVQGLNMFFLIDVSNSMNIEDYSESRLETIKKYIEITLRQEGSGHAFGLAVFTSSFYFLSPLTTDMETFLYILRQVNPGMLQSHGTRLTEALQDMMDVVQTVQKKSELGESFRRPYFVVISDGEDFSKSKINMSGYDDFKGQFVFVGIGKDKAMPVPEFRRGKKRFLYDSSGKLVMSRADFAQMKKLADVTGGRFMPFESDPLKDLLSQKSLHTMVGQTAHVEIKKPAYGIFGILLLILILLKFVGRYQISFWVLFLSMLLPQMLYATGPMTYYQHRQALKDLKGGNLDEAKRRLQKNLNDSESAGIEHYNLGVLESQQGNLKEAEKHLKNSEAHSFHQTKKSKESIKAEVFRSMMEGINASKVQSWGEAIEHFKQSLDAFSEVPNSETWAQAFQEKARAHLWDALNRKQQQQKQDQKNKQDQKSQQSDQSQSDPQKQEAQQKDSKKQEEKDQKSAGQKKEAEKKKEAAGQKDDKEKDQKRAEATEAEKKRAEEMKKRLMERKVKQDHMGKGRKVTPLVIPYKKGERDSRAEERGPAY